MSSNSANDGTYTLTVSFALGTNPDINTVNVNNRVQASLARLPQEVQRAGVIVRKQSSAVLQFIALTSERGAARPAVPVATTSTINMLDRLARVPGVGQVQPVRRASNYSMRIWFEIDRLTSLNLTPTDIVDGDPERRTSRRAVGRIGAQPIADDPAVPDQHPDPGPAGHAGAVRRHRHPRQPRRLGAAGARRGAGRARRRRAMDTESRLNGQPAVTIGIYLSPGANAVQVAGAMQAHAGRAVARRFPEGLRAQVFYDSTDLRRSTRSRR